MRSKALIRLLFAGVVPLAFMLPQASIAEPAMYFVHNDHLGTPVAMTNQSQVVVWQASREPFGATSSSGSVDEDARFPGQSFDQETGFHYNYYRDYDPTTGRYIQSDPIGLSGGLNTYSYVGGNSVNRIDPNGLNAVWAGRAGWAIGSGINSLAYHVTGITLSTIVANAIWNVFGDDDVYSDPYGG
jgi:RHS repeat-associated protein